MGIRADRTSCPRGSKHAIARNLVAILLSVCLVGYESSVAAVAEPIGRNSQDTRAKSREYRTSGIPTFGNFGPLKAAGAWQLPEGPIMKVLVIFESVKVQPYDFWDRSPSCLRCTGLPEKRKIVIDAIARNYAVFIPHPLDLEGKWDVLGPNSPDVLNVLYILAEWKSAIGLQDDVPTVALGVATGGEVLSILGLLPGIFESMAIMNSEGTIEAFESATRDYPPTVFMHMLKDTHTAQMIYYDRKLLSSNGVPTKEVRWCEHSVTPDWFAQLIPGVDEALSREIHGHLRQLGWLDGETGFLRPEADFQTKWFENVRQWKLLPPDVDGEEQLMFEERVLEELSVAFAYHVTLARNNDDLFAWFEGGYRGEEIHEYEASSLFRAAS